MFKKLKALFDKHEPVAPTSPPPPVQKVQPSKFVAPPIIPPPSLTPTPQVVAPRDEIQVPNEVIAEIPIEVPVPETLAPIDATANPDDGVQIEALPPEPEPEPEVILTAAERCGITHDMDPQQVRQQLAFLYRRYNRAASSLNANLRVEARQYLDAIAELREQHFGPA